ncbi:hypothetical protein CR513_40488, partial [Mucuna pruriens]
MVPHAHDDTLLIHFFQESLTGVALRWYLRLKRERRELAARIQPPLSENEMATMFIDTLHSPFYEKIVGNVASNFSDLVPHRRKDRGKDENRKNCAKVAIPHPNETPDSKEEEETT